MDLLVVDADSAQAGLVCSGLDAIGHRTVLVDCGHAALNACESRHFDAVVLDRALPDICGLAVIERLGAGGKAPPVLMLGAAAGVYISAQASAQERIEGLLAGADDYLTRPFDMGELDARLGAIVRRTGQRREEPEVMVGRLRLDPAGHRAVLGEGAVSLNRREYSLLAFLMRHADELVTRAMLLQGVWRYGFEPTTNIVESNLSRLRGRLERLGCDPVETRRGRGYVLRSDRCG
jgi:two-component system OmpR family response regulator